MTEHREAAQPLVESRLAHGVQNQIDAAIRRQPHRLGGEVLSLVVDDLVSAVLSHEIALNVARNRAEDARARSLGELHRREAHAAGGRMYNHGLAGFSAMAGVNHVPRRQHRDWKGRGLLEAQMVRDRNYAISANPRVLGVRAHPDISD